MCLISQTAVDVDPNRLAERYSVIITRLLDQRLLRTSLSSNVTDVRGSMKKLVLPTARLVILSAGTRKTRCLRHLQPGGWKTGIIRPRLKKAGLDEAVPSNYSPVANLPFLSKIDLRAISPQAADRLPGEP